MSLRILLSLKRIQLKRSIDINGAGISVFKLLGGLVIMSLLVATGVHFQENFLAVPVDTWAPGLRDAKSEGRVALEVAFWIAALLSSAISFRVMEALFRRDDIRALRALPFSGSEIFFERLITISMESLVLGLCASALFWPIFGVNVLLGGLTFILVVLGALFSSWLTFGTLMWLGSQFGSPDGMRLPGDAYGSSGAGFIYAPGAALTVSLVALLLLQLALGDVLVAQKLTRAFQLGISVVGTLSVLGLLLAWKECHRRYYLVSAWFNEADSSAVSLHAEHQKSEFDAQFMEKFVPEWARLTYRRLWIQTWRLGVLGRSLMTTGFILVLAVDFLWSPLPVWVFVAAPAVIFALGNPWRFAFAEVVGPHHSRNLPVFYEAEVFARFAAIGALWVRYVPAFVGAAFIFSLSTEREALVVTTGLLGPVFMAALQMLAERFSRAERVVGFLPIYSAVLWTLAATFSPLVSLVLGVAGAALLPLLVPRKPLRPVRL